MSETIKIGDTVSIRGRTRWWHLVAKNIGIRWEPPLITYTVALSLRQPQQRNITHDGCHFAFELRSPQWILPDHPRCARVFENGLHRGFKQT